MSKEKRQILQLSMSNLAKNLAKINGERLDFTYRPHLIGIYDINPKNIVLMTGRQVEKSTTAAIKMLLNAIKYPYFKQLYAPPQKGHCSDFSRDKLSPLIAESAFFSKLISQGRDVSGVMVNNMYNKYFINKSAIHLRWTWRGALATRGLSTDACIFDETQDSALRDIKVAEQTMSHSKYRYRSYYGTPKTLDNTLSILWDSSLQGEWEIKCPHCGHVNVLGLNNLGKDGPVCEHCKMPINPAEGRWAIYNEEGKYPGFHISQLIAPHKYMDVESWHELLVDIEAGPEDTVYNEILGYPYAYAAFAFTEDLLRKHATLGDIHEERIPEYSYGRLFAGIDWGTGREGKSATVLTILYMRRDDPLDVHLIYYKKYTGREWTNVTVQFQDIMRILNIFRPTLIGTDWGFGVDKNQVLRIKYGSEHIIEVYEASLLARKIQYNKGTDIYTINRTTMITDLVNTIKMGYYKFPSWRVFQPLAKDMLAERIETKTVNGRKVLYYDHNPTTPDDGLHSLLFAHTAMYVYLNADAIEQAEDNNH